MLLSLAKGGRKFLSFIKKNLPVRWLCSARKAEQKETQKNVFNAAAKLPVSLGNFFNTHVK